MKQINVYTAIAAGADPHMLGLTPVKITGVDGQTVTYYAPTDGVVYVTVTHTRIIAAWKGQRPIPCVAISTALPMLKTQAERRYAKYGVATVEEIDGDLTNPDEAVQEAIRLSNRAKRITEHYARIEKIRHPKGTSPIALAEKRKRKNARRDAIALAAFLKWCWDLPTPPYGPVVDKMVAAAKCSVIDVYTEYNK